MCAGFTILNRTVGWLTVCFDNATIVDAAVVFLVFFFSVISHSLLSGRQNIHLVPSIFVIVYIFLAIFCGCLCRLIDGSQLYADDGALM